MITVCRPCDEGLCPCVEGLCDPCDCSEPLTLVDASELSPAEIAHIEAHGTEAERAELAAYLAESDEAERLAGERDVFPELVAGGSVPASQICARVVECLRRSALERGR